MSEDASVNTGAVCWPGGDQAWWAVRRMQTKLHCWAAGDPGRRFDDLYNLVCDPAFLMVAWERVAGNTGSRTPGVDRATVAQITHGIGVEAFLREVREQLRARAFQPVEVRQVMIPKPSGKLRKLGIPTVTAKCRAPRRIFGSGADCSSVSCAGRSPACGVVRQATWP
jgi:RNA-directed DNA polymerase